jgi:hypothetical protein
MKRAFTLFLKILVALAVAYCVITTVRVWIGSGQQPQLQEGNEWVLLWCSVALTILRRWVGPIGKVWDLLHEVLLLAVHVSTGVGRMTQAGAPAQPPHQDGE